MKIQSPNQQRGVALVVSLIILVSLTMLGMTAIQRTTTDLSMAGNQRETGLMFQAAEIGLVAAEEFIDTSGTNSDYNNAAQGLHEVLADDTSYYSPDYYDPGSWTASSSIAGTSLVSTFGLKEEPRFMIEYLGDRKPNPLSGPNIGSYGTDQTGTDVSIYRATARGVGLTGNASRFVQAYYGKDAP